MGKIVFGLIFVFLMVGVLAASNVSDNSSEGSGVEIGGLEKGKFYTNNFYIFLGLVVLGLIILGFLVWLWIRGPKNRWE